MVSDTDRLASGARRAELNSCHTRCNRGHRAARMAKLDASAVATLLVEIGQRLVLAGENPSKARAYSRAAQNLLTLTLPLGEVIAAGRLREIPGVGAALAATIEQLYARGATPKLEALRADAPAGVLEMLRIPGLSPQKVRQIHKTLGIENLDDLESACRDGRVRTSKSLGPALETKILNEDRLTVERFCYRRYLPLGLDRSRSFRGRCP